jgi:NTE family protein
MSPGPDTMIQSAMDRRNLPALFALLPFLRDLDADYLVRISGDIEWFSIPAGQFLYQAGQPVDGLYVVINGAVTTFDVDADGTRRLGPPVQARELFGELELVTGGPRSTAVVALRDTEVARLPQATFEDIVRDYPSALRSLARVLAQRLDSLHRDRSIARAAKRIFAVVPHDRHVDAPGFAADLGNQLRSFGRTEVIAADRGQDQTSHWFHRVETANEYVVYVTDATHSNWTKLCLRHAQAILLLADARGMPRPWAALDADPGRGDPAPPADLVLLQRGPSPTASVRRWLASHAFHRHHLVRGPADLARVARLLSGRANGVVLSGGGARGFAHIGVLRALQEARWPIDAIGGTSIGAIIGAGWAMGWDYRELSERIRRTFVDTNPLSDYTIPLVSLLSGRKVGRLLRQEFTDVDIADLALPFFCVSANLTTGQAAVHRDGPLWLWLRASIAIPGVLPPVFSGHEVYVDGGTINNLPIDVMREKLDGSVIGVDVGAYRGFDTNVEATEMPPWWHLSRWLQRDRYGMNIMKILLRAGMINSASMAATQRRLADTYIAPPLDAVDLLDWQAFSRVVEIGYRHACEALGRGARPGASTDAAR